jgi:hypothetical protein
VNEGFQETAKAITELIDEIDKEAAVGGFAMQRVTLQRVSLLHESVDQKMTLLDEGITDIRAELLRQREQSRRSNVSRLDIRDEMVYGFLESFDEVSLKAQGIEYKISEQSPLNKWLFPNFVQQNPREAKITSLKITGLLGHSQGSPDLRHREN